MIEIPFVADFFGRHGVSERSVLPGIAAAGVLIGPAILAVLFIPSELAWRAWFTSGGTHRFSIVLTTFLWSIHQTLMNFTHYTTLDCWVTVFFSSLPVSAGASVVYITFLSPVSSAVFAGTYTAGDVIMTLFTGSTQQIKVTVWAAFLRFIFIIVFAAMLKETSKFLSRHA